MNRRIKQGVVAALLVGGVGVVAMGCLDRPVEHTDPNLKTNFTAVVENKVIDKIDILFDIDNSASMGDKQDYLKAAIPDLVNRLINPNCVDANGVSAGPSTNGTCANAMDKPEFPPVHDLHLGIISSSLGMRGGDACNPMTPAAMPFQNVNAHNDDQAHLLNRSLTYSNGGSAVTEGVVADAPTGDPYLYWFPSGGPNMGKTPGPGNPITNPTTLVSDFAELVGGTGVFGCGIESQLESWYRFLVQPDPYQSIVVNSKQAAWSGVDTTILKERHDFLRPDSLVAVIVLSDENDSEIDVRSLGGLAYNWMSTSFTPPKGTTACQNSSPGSPSCVSCAQMPTPNDPNCMGTPTYTALNDWGYDLNLRHVHTKFKYGIDPQFPIDRYVNGLTSTTVPDRCGEYGGCQNTPYAAPQSNYQGQNDCQNPLFAAVLPDGSDTSPGKLCHAPPGSRTKDLVFFAHIGGVPYQLLHFDPTNLANSVLSSGDWEKILGHDPEHFDYSNIDPHMLEDYKPRSGNGLAPPGSPNGTDPINGHEWVTNTSNGTPGYGMNGGHILAVDRQYACIFPLSDSTGNAITRDCTQMQNANFCDCPHVAGSVTAMELPPICDQTSQTKQTGAKAYPTIRELLVAKKMGNQGIVSSICPQHVSEMGAGDPLYGYRPAVAVIVDRLKNALTNQCLPQQLQPDQTTKEVPCLILLQVPGGAAGTSGTCLNPQCPMSQGLLQPDPDVLQKFCSSLEDDFHNQVSMAGSSTGLVDPANVPVCQLQQFTPTGNPTEFQGMTCAAAPDKGWCYVTGAAAGKCPQAIIFSPNALPNGATSNLQCLEGSLSVIGSGGTAGMVVGPSSGGGSSSSSGGTSSSSGGGSGGG
jgi:hypothetical protein